ncbi:MAG: leucine-rich repeat domain-containing protein, partial [Ruminococcus sp.]
YDYLGYNQRIDIEYGTYSGFDLTDDNFVVLEDNYRKYISPWFDLELTGDAEEYEVYNYWSNIVVEKGVTAIGSFAFSASKNVFERQLSYTLPNTLKTIKGGAFYTSEIKSIKIPDSVKALSSKVNFYKNDKEYLRRGTFEGCRFLGNVKISEKSKLKSIGYKTFAYSGLEYINSNNKIPNVTHVGNSAFCYTDIAKISLPKAEVYKSAFEECHRLNTVDISSTKKVRAYTFRGCWGLENIKLGNQLTWIGTESFKDCKTLKKITIPKNVEEIRYNAFTNDTNLKTVIINSKKLKAVRTDAFKNVSKDVVFKVPKSKLEQYKALIAPNAPETARFVGV